MAKILNVSLSTAHSYKQEALKCKYLKFKNWYDFEPISFKEAEKERIKQLLPNVDIEF